MGKTGDDPGLDRPQQGTVRKSGSRVGRKRWHRIGVTSNPGVSVSVWFAQCPRSSPADGGPDVPPEQVIPWSPRRGAELAIAGGFPVPRRRRRRFRAVPVPPRVRTPHWAAPAAGPGGGGRAEGLMDTPSLPMHPANDTRTSSPQPRSGQMTHLYMRGNFLPSKRLAPNFRILAGILPAISISSGRVSSDPAQSLGFRIFPRALGARGHSTRECRPGDTGLVTPRPLPVSRQPHTQKAEQTGSRSLRQPLSTGHCPSALGPGDIAG